MGARAVAKPTAIDLSDSQVDADDFAEIDDMYHSIDWLDWLSDGSINGLTDETPLGKNEAASAAIGFVD